LGSLIFFAFFSPRHSLTPRPEINAIDFLEMVTVNYGLNNSHTATINDTNLRFPDSTLAGTSAIPPSTFNPCSPSQFLFDPSTSSCLECHPYVMGETSLEGFTGSVLDSFHSACPLRQTMPSMTSALVLAICSMGFVGLCAAAYVVFSLREYRPIMATAVPVVLACFASLAVALVATFLLAIPRTSVFLCSLPWYLLTFSLLFTISILTARTLRLAIIFRPDRKNVIKISDFRLFSGSFLLVVLILAIEFGVSHGIVQGVAVVDMIGQNVCASVDSATSESWKVANWVVVGIVLGLWAALTWKTRKAPPLFNDTIVNGLVIAIVLVNLLVSQAYHPGIAPEGATVVSRVEYPNGDPNVEPGSALGTLGLCMSLSTVSIAALLILPRLKAGVAEKKKRGATSVSAMSSTEQSGLRSSATFRSSVTEQDMQSKGMKRQKKVMELKRQLEEEQHVVNGLEGKRERLVQALQEVEKDMGEHLGNVLAIEMAVGTMDENSQK
jgi:hypothetical protein